MALIEKKEMVEKLILEKCCDICKTNDKNKNVQTIGNYNYRFLDLCINCYKDITSNLPQKELTEEERKEKLKILMTKKEC